MWYHAESRQLQSNPPWQGWISDEAKAQYSDWAEVANDFVPPKFLSSAIEEAKQRITSGAALSYISGFYSSASGTSMYYDSDEDTQKLIPNVFNRTKESDWETKVRYPGICPAGFAPIRARPLMTSPESEKTVQVLNKEQLKQLMDDMDMAFYAVKMTVWIKQKAVQDILDNTSLDTEEKKVAEIDKIVW